ncbi:MAG TPA: hypothetical protein VF322_12700 [Gammaproteobacteria bacterium]
MAREPHPRRALTGLAAACGITGAIAACANGPVSAEPEVPAVIVDPTPQGRAELAGVVSAALGAPVTLSDDALTGGSVLVVERREPRDAQGRPLSGRSFEMPERFRLVLDGGRCVLVREATRERFPLAAVTCARADG